MKDRLLEVSEAKIRVSGSWLRTAKLYGDNYKFLDDPPAVLAALEGCGTRIDLFTFQQKLPHTELKYPYYAEIENLAVLPVTTFDDWWNKQIRSYPRNRARQAEKRGVVIREVAFDDELVKGIRAIYNEAPIRQGRRFPHYGKSFEEIRTAEATFLDTSVFIGAFFADELIGFVKLVYDDSRNQANLMNILSLNSHRDKAPTNALIAHSVKACAARGLSYLVYQKFLYNQIHSSLTTFKEVNGFSRVDMPRYYVPLTPLGSTALKFGLHRQLRRHIPPALVERIRSLRSTWYSRTTHGEKEPA